MKKLQTSCVMVLMWLTCNYASALNMTITVPSALTRSETTLGIQHALDSIRDSGGGALTLSGSTGTSVLVEAALIVYSNTTIQGDPNDGRTDTQFGMILVGENDTPSQAPSYRGNPLIFVGSSPTAGASNVEIYSLDIEGGTTGPPARPLAAQAISIRPTSSNVLVTFNKISGARVFGILAKNTSYLTVSHLNLTLNTKTKTGSEPEGGAGIWCQGCQNADITENTIQAFDFF